MIDVKFVGFHEGFNSGSTTGGSNTTNTGDMLKSVYDSNDNSKVDLADNALTVNGKYVELDVLDIPISPLEASDDWDSI